MRTSAPIKKIFRWFMILLVALFLIITYLSLKYFDRNGDETSQEPTYEPSEWSDVEPEPLGDQYYKDWNEFQHEQFSIYYPEHWVARDMQLSAVRYLEYEDGTKEERYTIDFHVSPNDDLLTIDQYVQQLVSFDEGGLYEDNQVLEQYPVVVNDRTFQHYLYRNQGIYYLAWYIMNENDDIFEMKSVFQKEPESDFREEILTIFSTFSLKN